MSTVQELPIVADLAVERDELSPPNNPGPITLAGIVEMLLKDRRRLDELLRDDARQRELIPRLLAIALAGFALYGVTTTLLLNAIHQAHHFWMPGVPAADWNGPTAANLLLAYSLGLIAANGICLPSFYFYSLLAGVRVTLLQVTAHALKGMAAGAIALVGVLPLYVAFALSAVVFHASEARLMIWIVLGLVLPFLAGTWGAVCLYQGFVCLGDTIAAERRHARTCFLRRLIVAWSGCYTFVTPWVIYTLWHYLSRS